MLDKLIDRLYRVIRAMKNWQQFLLMTLLGVGFSFYVGKESIDRYVSEKAKIEIEKLRIEERTTRKQDSITFSKAQKFWSNSIKDELAIRSICDDMEEFFERETQLSVFKIHDHGDVLAPENNPRVTVKWSSLVSIQDNYQDQPIYTGALWAINEADEKEFFYMPDLEKFPLYYRAREKAFHESIGSKSAAFMFVKDIHRDNLIISKWFIAIHWGIKDPYENPYFLKIKLEQFAKILSPKIYLPPEELTLKY